MNHKVKTVAIGIGLLAAIHAQANTFNQQPQPASQRVSFYELASRCAPNVHPSTLQAIARVESGFNPYAIGVVRGALPRQPKNLAEAIFAAKALHQAGKNFSMGLMQVNKSNLKKYGLTYETVFDVCRNLTAGAAILSDCFVRSGSLNNPQTALQKALSCYYSGNFRFGFTRDFAGQPSYVQKVLMSAKGNQPNQIIRVPAIDADTPVLMPAKTASALAKPKNTTASAAAAASSTDVQETNPAAVRRKAADWDVFSEF